MKTGIFCAGALSLAGLAAAFPSSHRRHEHLHERRQEVVVTEVDYVTATAPDVLIYVNADGEVLYTSTVGQAAATSVAEVTYSAAAYTSESAPVATTVTAASSTYAAAAASSSTSSSSAASSSSSASSNGISLSGASISYSPYTGSYEADDVTCKTAAEVTADFEKIIGYSMVRIYGTDCNQVANVLSAASAKGMKVMAGVYDISEVESEIATIVSAATGNWDSIHTISIGNELVNSGSATVSEVTSALTTARGLLKTAGYTGNIVTVDTFNAIIANPELCEASDFAAANAHPFFDTDVTAQEAGKWVSEQVTNVGNACSGKTVWITETGWPNAGDSNGAAVPSETNQGDAVSSIKSNVASNVVFLTAFDDTWKAPGYLNVEQYWGLIAGS